MFDAYTHQLKRLDDDSGVGYAARVLYSTYGETYAVVSTYGLEPVLPTRLLVNDAGLDSDGDGLGPGLEKSRCTCDTASSIHSCLVYNPGLVLINVDCSTVANLKDTDGDGINDNYEIVGKDDLYYPQSLVKWGANPLRKDVFVELDWIIGAAYWPTGQTANEVADYFNAQGTAGALGNLDLSDGIKVHLDIRRSGGGTTFGDWGGSNQVPSNTDWKNPPSSIFQNVRRDIFHYGLIASAGQAKTIPGQYFVAPHNAATIAHELGHDLAIPHFGRLGSGGINCKPHYQSIMNYAYQLDSSVAFSQKAAPHSGATLAAR